MVVRKTTADLDGIGRPLQREANWIADHGDSGKLASHTASPLPFMISLSLLRTVSQISFGCTVRPPHFVRISSTMALAATTPMSVWISPR